MKIMRRIRRKRKRIGRVIKNKNEKKKKQEKNNNNKKKKKKKMKKLEKKNKNYNLLLCAKKQPIYPIQTTTAIFSTEQFNGTVDHMTCSNIS